MSRDRRQRLKEPLAPVETTQIKRVLGALQRVAVNTQPWLCAEISLAKGKESKGDGELLLECSKIVRKAKQLSHIPLKCYPSREPLAVVSWSDSAFACRQDGASQGGRLFATVDNKFLEGQWGPATLISWDSKKLPRKARSTPCAETQALAEAVGELDCIRAAVAELFYGKPDIHDWVATVKSIPGTAVVDCKPTYDACKKSESSNMGLTDKHMALECISLRDKIQLTDIDIR